MVRIPTFTRPPAEMGLKDVINDFRSSLRNAPGVSSYELSFIKSEDRGLIIEAGLSLSGGQRVRSCFHLPPADSPAAPQARSELAALVVLTDWTSFPGSVPGVDLIWDDETRSWQEWHGTPPRGIVGPGSYELIGQIWIGAAALWFLGKLADAYVSRLADRLAESTFKAVGRISLRRRRHERDHVSIEVPEGTTVIVLPPGLSDDAREAFIDLDTTADGIRGNTLYWEQEKRVWVPRD